MAIEFKVKQEFDPERMRHYINGELSVMHCHHYATLFSQLADDAKLLKGAKLLADSVEESTLPVLEKYYKENNITSLEDKASIAEQYFGFIGLGKVEIKADDDGGTAEMNHAHVDEGWVKKWGKRDAPVNFIGQGFLAGAFSAITGNKAGDFKVEETQSIVSGASSSKFNITKK